MRPSECGSDARTLLPLYNSLASARCTFLFYIYGANCHSERCCARSTPGALSRALNRIRQSAALLARVSFDLVTAGAAFAKTEITHTLQPVASHYFEKVVLFARFLVLLNERLGFFRPPKFT